MSKNKKGKIYLVESCSFPRNTYKNVTNDEKFKTLKESAIAAHNGRNRLNEAVIDVDTYKKRLIENNIDSEVQARVIKNLKEIGANLDEIELWQFPISRVNTKDSPNLNGRVYNRQLWENVLNEQTDIWKTGSGLANHPEDKKDGDFMSQSIVWLDGFIGDDDIVYGIGTLVGEGGALARQIISVGGRIGFSSSGYGEFLDDDITVDPDDYEIDRFADLVLNPSQGVYGDVRDAMKITNESVENKNQKQLTESVVSSSKKSINEANEVKEAEDDEDLTLSESLVLEHYTEAIKDINKESNKLWESKIQKLESLVKRVKKENLSKSSKTKINEQITNLIEAIMKDTRKAIAEGYDARKICEELEISNISKLANIKEKFEDFASMEECLNETTKEAKKYKELYEAREAYAISEAEASYESDEKLESLNKEVRQLKKALTESNDKNKNLSKQLNESNTKGAKLDLELSKANDTISSLTKSLNEYKELQEQSKTSNKNLRKRLSSLVETKNKTNDVKETLIENKQALLLENKKLYTENNKLKNLLSEAERTIATLKRANLRSKVSLVEDKRKLKNLTAELNESSLINDRLQRAHKNLRAKNGELLENFEDIKQRLDETQSDLRDLKFKSKQEARERLNLSRSLQAEKAKKEKLEIEKASKLAEERKIEEARKREDRLEAVRNRLREKADQEKKELREAEFYDERDMFNDSENVDNYLNTLGIEDSDRSDLESLKTVREVQDNLLFNNELLSDEAEIARENLRKPTDNPTTLSELFR